MTTNSPRRILILAVGLLASVTLAARQTAPEQKAATPAERVAALKQALQDSQKQLRSYEWAEATVISLKGEEKARKQQRCYYGADGKLQKVPLDGAAPEAKPAEPEQGGRRGGRVKQAVIENKKDDLKDYMEQATALIQKYVPPDPEDIQRAKAKAKVEAPAPGQARVTFADYLQPGDRMTVNVDAAANRPLGISVATYLKKKEDTVTLDVKFSALPDGTIYVFETVLEAKAKNIRVVIQNTGHRLVK